MPLKCELGNWDKYIAKYRSSDTQWYLIPKAKTYSYESIRLLIQGLNLLSYWFSEPELLPEKEKIYLESYLQHPQQKLFSESFVFRWGAPAQVFFASKLFVEGIISREQQSEDLKVKFDEIIQIVERGKNYYEVERKFGKDLLINWFSANARNFINIYQKLGLAWVEENHLVTITSIGKRLIENNIDYRPILEHQLRKLQYYNPTFERIKKRYGHIKVFPFNFCLQLIMNLQPHEITKQEFALFVTKAITMEDITKCVAWINSFRQLGDEQRGDIIKKLTRRQKGRERPVFVEALETASKDINFLTLSGPWTRETLGDSEGIILKDEERAKGILEEDQNLHFVDFESKESWFCHYGDISKKSDIKSAIDYYARIGNFKKAKELAKKAPDVKEAVKKLRERIEEKHIEDFYRNNLGLIESGLKLYKVGGRTGQQFETPDGGVIDLLTLSQGKSFVVIEFKRDKISDEAVGQILRYMGWVRKHLSPEKIVRGYIVAREFDRYMTYALHGMQHPLIPNPKGDDLIRLFRHGIDISKMGTVDIKDVE